MAVIDVHTHMLSREWLELIRECGPPEYVVQQGQDGNPWIFESGFMELPTTPEMFDYDTRIRAMNAAGIDVSILSLTAPNVYWGGEAISSRAARLMNDDMARAQALYPDRIRFLASLPWQYPDLALAELDRALDLGAVGVMVLANIRGRELIDPAFARVWKVIDECGLPVLVHPTQPPGFRDMNLDFLKGSVGFPFDTTLALSKMVFDGFLDRYPGLKIIASHAGGMLPYIAGRIDLFYGVVPPEERRLAEPPSSYVRRMYFDAITYQMDALHMLVGFAGSTRVLFGTDYPHPTDVVGILARINRLGARPRSAILGRNAERLFGL